MTDDVDRIEYFENDLDASSDEMEGDIISDVSNMFAVAEADRLKSDKYKADGEDVFHAFTDDLFTDEGDNEIVIAIGRDNTDTKSKVVEKDSDSDSSIKFSLFDDTDDDDDDLDLCTGITIQPGSKLINSNITEKLDTKNLKTKVDESNDMLSRNCVNDKMKVPPPVGNTGTKGTTGPTPDDDNFCCICMDEHTNPKTLKKCSHSFCTECIDEHFKIKPTCPVCFAPYGIITGNMPKGSMTDYISTRAKLAGNEGCNTIVITYCFDDGIQTSEHPNPGQPYYGTNRTAYLPDNEEGRKVLKLLKASFDRRLTFTVGRSRTTGCDNVVTWNDIHHKTCTNGGQQNFGYPDPTYLQRVQEELAAHGVTEDSLKENK